MKLFVDSGGYIALMDEMDQYHRVSMKFVQHWQDSDEIHTSNYVVDEVLTRLRLTAGLQTALKFRDKVFRSEFLKMHYVDPELEREALKIFEKYKDKIFSFTDATTIALINRLRIRHIFGFDGEFRKIGYELLPQY